MKLKNELRNAVGCCLRLETSSSIQITDSNESKIDSSSLNLGGSFQPMPTPTTLHSTSPTSSSSSSCSSLPSDGKEVVMPSESNEPSETKKSLFMNADRRTVHAEVNFLQFHKSQDIFIPFGEICRRSSDYIACLKSSNTLAEENSVLRNLLTSIESELSNAVLRVRKIFIEEVEYCVSNHAVFLIDMVSAFVSSFKDGRALDNLRKRNIDGGVRPDSSRESSVQMQPVEAAGIRPDSNQCATSSELTNYTPTHVINSSTISDDFVPNDGESYSVGNNDHADLNPPVGHHNDNAADEAPR